MEPKVPVAVDKCRAGEKYTAKAGSKILAYSVTS